MIKADDIRSILAMEQEIDPHTVTFEGQDFPCLYYEHSDPVVQQQNQRVQQDNIYVQCSAQDLAGIKQGADIQVDGAPWRAMRVEKIQDGLMLQIWLGCSVADSISKQIVSAIIALLSGDGGPAGMHITRERTFQISEDIMPEVAVYRLKEQTTQVGDPRRPALIQRNFFVEIAITAARMDGEPAGDACDLYQQWVVKQLASDLKLGGLAKSVTEVETDWTPEEGSNGGSMTTFLRYRVEYMTPAGDITSTTK